MEFVSVSQICTAPRSSGVAEDPVRTKRLGSPFLGLGIHQCVQIPGYRLDIDLGSAIPLLVQVILGMCSGPCVGSAAEGYIIRTSRTSWLDQQFDHSILELSGV